MITLGLEGESTRTTDITKLKISFPKKGYVSLYNNTMLYVMTRNLSHEGEMYMWSKY